MADDLDLRRIEDQLRVIARALDTHNKILIGIRDSLQAGSSAAEGQRESVYEERFKGAEPSGTHE
jgi:hypothetical protein